tara:strand:- start:3209 stop:3706 length:498 start_codon:yes stop_codon:yes gene_type:complete
MNASITLEQRIANLEAISEIKGLKYRYWQACDQKDPHSMIECFASEGVVIDYEDFGCFKSADLMVKKYIEFACHPHLLESHHGKNEIIELDETGAHGTWSMNYSLVDEKNQVVIQLNGVYQDWYINRGSGWLIQKTKFTKMQTVKSQNLDQIICRPKAARTLGFK